MQRVKRSTAVAVLPAAPASGTPGYFAAPDPVGGVPATVPGFEWYNAVQEEIVALITAAGLTLSSDNNAQMLEAVQRLIDAQSGNYALDTGAANAYVVALNPAIAAYTDGMTVRVKIVNTNTGAATLNAGGGAVPLVNDVGGALVAGDLPAGGITTATYIASGGKFYLTSLVPSQAMSQTQADARYIAQTAGGSTVGQFRNLALSATGTNSSITGSVDEIVVENGGNQYQTLRAVALAINSAAVGANGLDTGVLAASTWYSVWVIWNGTTTAGLISLSATAPTLPAGYTHKARVGWVRTDGTANKYPLSFIQYGRKVQYKLAAGSNVTVYPPIASGTAASLTAASVSSAAPTTAASVRGSFCTTVLGAQASIGANSVSGAFNYTNGNVTGYAWGVFLFDLVLESTNLYWSAPSGGGSVLIIGWEDNI